MFTEIKDSLKDTYLCNTFDLSKVDDLFPTCLSMSHCQECIAFAKVYAPNSGFIPLSRALTYSFFLFSASLFVFP